MLYKAINFVLLRLPVGALGVGRYAAREIIAKHLEGQLLERSLLSVHVPWRKPYKKTSERLTWAG